MFLQNKYTRIYFSLVEKAKSRTCSEYTERHHIIPLSLGGKNITENLVRLTAREHYVAHLLLCRMTEDDARRSMIFAFSRMNASSKTHKRHAPKSRWYDHHRKLLAEAMRSRTISKATRNKIGEIARNRAPESIEKMRAAKSRKCTIDDGKTIFKSRKELGETLGWGKTGAGSPTFKYV